MLTSPFRFRPFALVVLASVVALAATPAGFAQDAEADRQAALQFNIIATAYNNGLYEKSAAKWAEFIQAHSNYKRIDEAHFFLANSQLNTKKFNEAIATYNTLQQKYPKFAQLDAARYNLAMARFQIASASNKPEDFKQAAAALNDMIAKHAGSPFVPRAYYYLGEAHYAAGDTEAASAAYQALADKFPDSKLAADALYFLGVAKQDLEQFDAAIAAYEKFLTKPALAKHELADEIRLRQAICYHAQEKFDQAEKRFAEAAQNKQSPLAEFAMLRRGECLISAGKLPEAAGVFAELLKAFPNGQHISAARLAAGKCQFDLEKYNEAKALLAQAAGDAKASPQQASEAAYYLALTHLKLDQPAEALKVVEPAIGKFAETEMAPFLLSTKADALYDIPDRRGESLPVYQQVLQKYPQHQLAARALYMSAVAAFDVGDYDAAGKFAKSFLDNANFREHELTPHLLFISAEAQLFSGGQTDAGKRQAAEALYRKLVSEHPDSDRAGRAHLRIAWCFSESGKTEEAIKYLEGNADTFKQPQQRAEAELMIGRAHATLSRHEPALAALAKARQHAPDWQRGDEVLLESARSLRAQDNPGDAKARLNELLSKYPQSALRARATFDLGEIARVENDPAEAQRRFTEAANNFGESDLRDPARYALAAVHFQAEEYQQAAAALDQLLTSASDDALRARGLHLRGLTRQRLNQFAPAAEDLKAFLATNPPQEQGLDARFTLALCHIGAKDNAAAIAALNEILSAGADYPRADRVCYELGHALLLEKKPADAASAFEQLATKHPASPLAAEAWFHVGSHAETLAEGVEDDAQRSTHLAAAAKAFQAGLTPAKTSQMQEKLSYKLGDMQFRQQQYQDAAATLKKQLEQFPQGELAGPARYLAAESYYHAGELPQALPLFQQVAADKVEKYLDRSLYRVGQCASGAKDWKTAQQGFQQLIQQFPEFPQLNDARYGLAFALQNQNQHDAAIALYQQVAERSTSESGAKARFMLGSLAFAKKEYDDAIFQFGAVVSGYQYPHWQGLSQFEMARCFRAQEKESQAIATLEKMLADFPDHEAAEDAKRILAELKK